MRFLLAACLGLTVLFLTPQVRADDGDAAKPILIFGSGYGIHERRAIINEVITPAELTFDDGGGFVSAEMWPQYALVIVCNASTGLQTPKELDWVTQYVAGGGRVLLLGTVLHRLKMFKPEEVPWLGAIGYGFGVLGEAAYPAPDHWAAPKFGTREAIGRSMQGGYYAAKTTAAQSLVTIDGKTTAFINQYKEGEVFYVGCELFRVRVKEKESRESFGGDELVAWLKHLIVQGNPLARSELIERGLQQAGLTEPMVWFRDPGLAARGAAYFRHPYPRAGEHINAVKLDVGLDEWESFPLYVSTVNPVERFAVTVTDLQCEDGKTLPASRFRIRQQGLAADHLTVGDYWLLDAPLGTLDFALKAKSTSTFWFTFDTRGCEPGIYRGRLHLGQQTCDLAVHVWDVALPRREYFQAQATYMWASLGADPAKVKPGTTLDYTVFDRHMDSIASHHIDYNADVSWGFAAMNNAVVRDTGKQLAAAIAAGEVSPDHLPDLDLSVYNHFVDAAIDRGMPWFHALVMNRPTDWIGWTRRIYGREIPPDAPEHVRIRHWLIGQVSAYLRDRGLRRIVDFMADEIPPSRMPEIIERAKPLKDSGISPMLTITGHVGAHRDSIQSLRESCDVWLWNWQTMAQSMQFVAEDPNLIKPGDLQYTYTAQWHFPSYVDNRQRGAYLASIGLDGWYIHGYLRWYPNGGAVFGGPDGPIATEGWEGARDGIEDARYYARLMHLCKILEHHPKAAPLAKQWRATMDTFFGTSDALINLRAVQRDYDIPSLGGKWSAQWMMLSSDITRLRQLKTLLLSGIAQLQPYDAAPLYLTYGGKELARGDRMAVDLVGHADGVVELRHVLAARLELDDLLDAVDAVGTLGVAVGDDDDHPLVAQLRSAGDLRVTARYPAAGDFVIVTSKDERSTAIYARDHEGLRRGIRQFVNLVQVRTR